MVGYQQSVRLAAITRDEIVARIADAFEASGTKYTCAAVVHDFATPLIAAERAKHEWPDRSRFKHWSMVRSVGDEIHRRWNEREGLKRWEHSGPDATPRH